MQIKIYPNNQMKNLLEAFQDFSKKHELDTELFYSIHFMQRAVFLQGFSNKNLLELAFKMNPIPVLSENGFLSFKFDYNEIKFEILLT